jgi:imidazolonepropionase-like amidohydrolase
MATLNAGLALKQNIGSVEPGKEADLAANPLVSLQNAERIEIVIKAGQLYTP